MLWNWLPWKFIIRRLAQSRGFLDPITAWSYLRRFAQPSDVGEPIELLRAGVLFHTRGLLNSRAIQHNLDWVWPYWVERQFNPRDDAFVPRAFSITHINLTHRNWTAVGLPDCPALPIVDPRGLVTPYLDGWSLDAWVLTGGAEPGSGHAGNGQGGEHHMLIPSRLADVDQEWHLDENLWISTEARQCELALRSEAEVKLDAAGQPYLELRLRASADAPERHPNATAWLAIGLRPYNPEGISIVHQVDIEADHRAWRVDGRRCVEFSDEFEQHAFSHYRAGDVFHHIPSPRDEHEVKCEVGMATAAILYALPPGAPRTITLTVPLGRDTWRDADGSRPLAQLIPSRWPEALADAARLRIPDARMQFLYDAALRTLILHSPGDIYPGPYTYKRFWFRDAAFIMNAMLCAGLAGRVERVLDRFPERQSPTGYFHSQEGEWDSNGEALWILGRWCALTGRPPKPQWAASIRQGAQWIKHKRLPETTESEGQASPAGNSGPALHAGLMPAGFSAEHLGLNDYYFWDDFWSVAGLRAASRMLRELGDEKKAAEFAREADEFIGVIERSLAGAAARLGRPAMPASPYRRLDAGAIGSVTAGYPLQLWGARDERQLDTADYLMADCFVQGGFFQDMIHSGINAYLSLHIAQVLLRADDPRFAEIIRVVAGLATSTGQWPEAIHPRTHGGCMGDGQHVWAACEWVMMVRNCFVREEGIVDSDKPDTLILGQGLLPEWLKPGEPIRFGPAPTLFGEISIEFEMVESGAITARWQGRWRGPEPRIELRLPGCEPVTATPNQSETTIVSAFFLTR